MQELEDAVIAAFKGMVSSGKLNQIIEKKVGETVESVVDSALRSYSDFGKSLSAAVQESLCVDKEKLALPGYNEIVLQIVKKKLEHSIEVIGKERLEKDLENLLSGGVPREVTVSKLVEGFKAWVREESYGNDYDDRITYIEEKSQYGGGWIHLDSKSQVREVCLPVPAWIWERWRNLQSATISGQDAGKKIFLGGLYGFERTLFQFYAVKTRIIIDTAEPDIYRAGRRRPAP
ncbi:MAG: hypothetical protein U0800_12595 [Isosphaeraceae bacterium]